MGGRRRGLWALGGLALALAMPAWSFQAAVPAPVSFTTEQDHRNMMEQLGITQLRPGRSGFPGQPNPANYDPALANPYPDWPELMRLENGRAVTTADQWWRQRRPQLVELFEREVVGRVPANVPSVSWSKVAEERENLGGTPIIARQMVGRVDNSAYPAIDVNLQMMLVLPERRTGPVPLLIMFGRANFPAPVPPSPDELARMNAALKATLAERDPALARIFAEHPGYQPFVGPAFPPPPPPAGDPPNIQQLVAAGWGVAMLDTASVQADNGAGLTRGIIGLVNKGQPRKPDDWGALRAWGWGASRVLDHLETVPEVDARRVGIEGVSRWGKAALVTAAFDQRFHMVLIGSSGEGGVKPHRRNFGESVENLTGAGGYHWMAGNFLKYGTERGRLGRKDAGDIPVDSHQLLALVAPRLAFVSYGIPEQGDANWLDQQGSFMATVAAGPAWRLLGARDLGITENYRAVVKPPVNQNLLGGHLAWRQHDGGHTDQPNMKWFIAWADKMMGRPKAPASPPID